MPASSVLGARGGPIPFPWASGRPHAPGPAPGAFQRGAPPEESGSGSDAVPGRSRRPPDPVLICETSEALPLLVRSPVVRARHRSAVPDSDNASYRDRAARKSSSHVPFLSGRARHRAHHCGAGARKPRASTAAADSPRPIVSLKAILARLGTPVTDRHALAFGVEVERAQLPPERRAADAQDARGVLLPPTARLQDLDLVGPLDVRERAQHVIGGCEAPGLDDTPRAARPVR